MKNTSTRFISLLLCLAFALSLLPGIPAAVAARTPWAELSSYHIPANTPTDLTARLEYAQLGDDVHFVTVSNAEGGAEYARQEVQFASGVANLTFEALTLPTGSYWISLGDGTLLGMFDASEPDVARMYWMKAGDAWGDGANAVIDEQAGTISLACDLSSGNVDLANFMFAYGALGGKLLINGQEPVQSEIYYHYAYHDFSNSNSAQITVISPDKTATKSYELTLVANGTNALRYNTDYVSRVWLPGYEDEPFPNVLYPEEDFALGLALTDFYNRDPATWRYEDEYASDPYASLLISCTILFEGETRELDQFPTEVVESGFELDIGELSLGQYTVMAEVRICLEDEMENTYIFGDQYELLDFTVSERTTPPELNSEARMHWFFMSSSQYYFGGASINESLGTLSYYNVPYAVDLTALVPSFEVSSGATVEVDGVAQVSGETVQNFVSPVVYTVTSEDQSTVKTYTATVYRSAPSTAALMSKLEFTGLPPECELAFDRLTNAYTLYVPEDCAGLSAAVPQITVSNFATVSPSSGAPLDLSGAFDTPLAFTVTAQDGVTQTVYMLSVRNKQAGSNLQGTVYTYENGVQSPVAGRKVYLKDLYWESTYWQTNYMYPLSYTTTDAQGSYSFSEVESLSYTSLYVTTEPQSGEYSTQRVGKILHEPGFRYIAESMSSMSIFLRVFKSVSLGQPNNLEYILGDVTITGKIIDNISTLGIGDAKVAYHEAVVYTQQDGTFRMPGIAYNTISSNSRYDTMDVTRYKYRPGVFYPTGNSDMAQNYTSLKQSATLNMNPTALARLDSDDPFYSTMLNSLSATPSPVGRFKPIQISVRYYSEEDLTDALIRVRVPEGVFLVDGSCANPLALITDQQLTLRGDIRGNRQYSLVFWAYASYDYPGESFTVTADALTNTGALIGTIGTADVRLIGLKLYLPGEVTTDGEDSAPFNIYGDFSNVQGGKIAITVEGPDGEPRAVSRDLSGLTAAGYWFKAYDVAILGAGAEEAIYTFRASLLDENGAELDSAYALLTVTPDAVSITDIALSCAAGTSFAPDPVSNSSYVARSLTVGMQLQVPAFTLKTTVSHDPTKVTAASYVLTTSHGSFTVPARWDGNAYVGEFSGYTGSGVATVTLMLTREQLPVSFTVAQLSLLIDPSGYVFDQETGERVKGATATLEVKDGSSWVLWNAHDYAQHNPQITDEEGRYGWFVPEGEYRVLVRAEGYEPYSTEADPAYGIINVLPPRDDVYIGLVRVAAPEPVITSLTVTTPTITETLAAYLNITAAGDRLSGETLTAYLMADGALLYPTALTLSNGVWKGRMHILSAPSHETNSKIVVAVGDGAPQGDCPLTILRYDPAQLWAPTARPDTQSGKIVIAFSERIAPRAGGYTATIGGVSCALEQTGDRAVTLNKSYADVASGTKIVVGGVKYPDMFPSYSFTFTVTIP